MFKVSYTDTFEAMYATLCVILQSLHFDSLIKMAVFCAKSSLMWIVYKSSSQAKYEIRKTNWKLGLQRSYKYALKFIFFLD